MLTCTLQHSESVQRLVLSLHWSSCAHGLDEQAFTEACSTAGPTYTTPSFLPEDSGDGQRCLGRYDFVAFLFFRFTYARLGSTKRPMMGLKASEVQPARPEHDMVMFANVYSPELHIPPPLHCGVSFPWQSLKTRSRCSVLQPHTRRAVHHRHPHSSLGSSSFSTFYTPIPLAIHDSLSG